MGGTVVLYTDGASRGNPGPAGIGAALFQVEDGRLTPIGEVSEEIGITTNNVAEYRAVVAGLSRAAELAPDRLVLRADSQLLIRQLQGRYRVKAENLRPLFEQARQLLNRFPSVKLEHVPREDNTVADALANAALDG